MAKESLSDILSGGKEPDRIVPLAQAALKLQAELESFRCHKSDIAASDFAARGVLRALAEGKRRSLTDSEAGMLMQSGKTCGPLLEEMYYQNRVGQIESGRGKGY